MSHIHRFHCSHTLYLHLSLIKLGIIAWILHFMMNLHHSYLAVNQQPAQQHKEGEDLEEREDPTFSFCFKFII